MTYVSELEGDYEAFQWWENLSEVKREELFFRHGFGGEYPNKNVIINIYMLEAQSKENPCIDGICK